MESQNFAPQRHQITANSPIQSALEAVSPLSGTTLKWGDILAGLFALVILGGLFGTK